MSTYTIFPSTRFKKDYKKFLKKQREKEAIQMVIRLLAENGHEAIPQQMKPHTRHSKIYLVLIGYRTVLGMGG